MKKVVALQTWSNGTITMDEKSVMDIDVTLADSLIAAGICADAEDYFGTGGGGGGGGVLVAHTYEDDGDLCLDKNYTEIVNAMKTGGACVEYPDGSVYMIIEAFVDDGYCVSAGTFIGFLSDTADGVLKFFNK